MVIVGEIDIWDLPIEIVQGEDSYLIPIDNPELVKFGDLNCRTNIILRSSSKHVTSPRPIVQPNPNVVPFQQFLSTSTYTVSPTIPPEVQQPQKKKIQNHRFV